MCEAPAISASGTSARNERVVGAAVGEEAALAVRVDQSDEPAGRAIRVAGEMGRDACAR